MDVVTKARHRIAALERELAQLRDFISVAEALAGQEVPDVDGDADGAAGAGGGGVAATTFAKPAQIEAAVKDMISEAGRPLTRAELFNGLKGRGVLIPGKEPRRNLSTILWRSSDIDNLAGVGYWLRSLGHWKGNGRK